PHPTDTKSSMRLMLRGVVKLSPLTALMVGAAVVQGKVLAVLLGPSGTGFVSLSVSFMTLLSTLTSLGMGQSLAKIVAELRGAGKQQQVRRAVISGLTTVASLSAVASMIIYMRPAE